MRPARLVFVSDPASSTTSRARLATLAVIAGLAFAAPLLEAGRAAAAPKNTGQCFFVGDVNGFSAPDDHTVLVRVGVNEVWRLDLMGPCGDLTFRQRLGFERTPGDPWICSPLDATIINREAGAPLRCPVTSLRKLTPADIAALPKRDLP